MYQLTKRELEVLEIFWEQGRSLISSDVSKINTHLTPNTVTAVLRKLLEKKFIYVDEIVYSGTVLTRSYKPTISEQEFLINNLIDRFKKAASPNLTLSRLISAVLDQEDASTALKDIDEMTSIIRDYKKRLSSK